MNTLDFEKTQVWAKNLINAPAQPVPAQASIPAPPMMPEPKKPELKKLTKQEKIILATGGALAIGLGVIVITSLPEEETAPPIPKADLTAPILDLDMPEPVAEVETPEPAVEHKPSRPARPHSPKKEMAQEQPRQQEAPAQEPHHALLEIPDVPEVATKVGDELTFIEAFNVARDEVGPAGLFAWRNTYYSTFTDREWDLVPEDQKEKWLEAAEPIIDPGYENLSEGIPSLPAEVLQHVVVAERGEITWTGIDKNGDGQAEILMARINGQSPMVLLDADGDGILDKRYDYEPGTGKTFASSIEPFSMSISDIEHLEFIPVEPDMGFFNHSGNEQISESLPVSIYTENNQYVVSVDSNLDQTVDAITYLTDDRGPVVGLDYDNDGQIEMGYVYDADSQTLNALEMDPMDALTLDSELPDLSMADDLNSSYPEEIPDFDSSDDMSDQDGSSNDEDASDNDLYS